MSFCILGSSDSTLKLWKGRTCLHTFQGHTGLCFCFLFFSPSDISFYSLEVTCACSLHYQILFFFFLVFLILLGCCFSFDGEKGNFSEIVTGIKLFDVIIYLSSSDVIIYISSQSEWSKYFARSFLKWDSLSHLTLDCVALCNNTLCNAF